MRQWMVDPETMCHQHLLGEHVEHHMFAGSIAKGTSMQGYLDKDLLSPHRLQDRHDTLSRELERRGGDHKSILVIDARHREAFTNEEWNRDIDVVAARKELHRRCPKCRKRWEKKYGK